MSDKRPENPDPNRYVFRRRKGKYVLVDRQVIRWEKRRKKARELRARAEKAEAIPNPRIKYKLFGGSDT
jgi:hypothetical protein